MRLSEFIATLTEIQGRFGDVKVWAEVDYDGGPYGGHDRTMVGDVTGCRVVVKKVDEPMVIVEADNG